MRPLTVPRRTRLAFHHFGGVPGRVRKDNLKPAVSRDPEFPDVFSGWQDASSDATARRPRTRQVQSQDRRGKELACLRERRGRGHARA